jgi:hypothetical protein
MVMLMSAADTIKHYLFIRLDVFQFDTYFCFSGTEAELKSVMLDWTNWLTTMPRPPQAVAENWPVDTSPCDLSSYQPPAKAAVSSLIVNSDWSRVEFHDCTALQATVSCIPAMPHTYGRFRVITDFYAYAQFMERVQLQGADPHVYL